MEERIAYSVDPVSNTCSIRWLQDSKVRYLAQSIDQILNTGNYSRYIVLIACPGISRDAHG